MSCNCGSGQFITRDEFESRMRWFERLFWPREAISNIEADCAWMRNQISVNQAQLMEEFRKMAANFDQLNADLNTLAAGYVSLQAANKQLQDALDAADADKAQAVADAIAADDAVDQAAVDAADAIAQAVLNPPAPPVEG